MTEVGIKDNVHAVDKVQRGGIVMSEMFDESQETFDTINDQSV